MLWRTHFLAGAAAGIFMSNSANIKTIAVSAGIAGVAALLPDLDDPHSKLGRIIAPASWVVKATIGHRGPLHSLLGAGLAFILALLLLKANNGHLAPMVAAGYVSHLVMDSINPQGVPWLWPVKVRVGLPLVTTGGLLEKLLVSPGLVVLTIWLGWQKLY